VVPLDDPTAERVVVRISATSAVMAVLAVVVTLMVERTFVAAHAPLSWAAAAVVVAVLIDPLVELLARHIPRVAAVLLALLVVAAAIFGVAYRAFDDLSGGIDRLGEAAADSADQLEDRDDGVGQLANDVDASRRVDSFIDALEDRATGGDDVLASTAGTAPTYAVSAVLTVFLMSYGPRLARAALAQVPGSARRRARIARIADRAIERARRAILLIVGEGVVAGVGVGLAAEMLDVPAPAALGLAAGIMALLPHVGLVLGTLPFLLLVIGLRSDEATIVAVVVIIACQLADSMFVRPRLAARSVHVGLLVPWAVALVGYVSYGVGGAAYSLAFAVFALAVVDEVGVLQGEPVPGGPDAGSAGSGPGAAATAAARVRAARRGDGAPAGSVPSDPAGPAGPASGAPAPA
jgi:predicted PurR-regulated permease PerM